MRGLLLFALAGCAADPVVPARAALTSTLWGTSGEAFNPRGRLMDWSYAGYHAGDDPLPDVPAVVDVADFGAVGDGTTDDGAAFESAVDAVSAAGGGAVTVGAGTFVLRRRLSLSTGVVLRGAGRDATTLHFPEALEDLYPGERNWSFSGGFIQANASSTLPELTDVVAPAARGDTEVTVADASEIAPGDWVLIRQVDMDGTLMRRLHADLADGGTDNIGDIGMRFPTRVLEVAGNTLTLERALPVDVEARWSPTVFAVEPRISEVGVEHLTMSFPHTVYPGHFNERGYNAIHFSHVWHGWVREVTVLNCDYGISFTNTFFSTATGVVLETTASRGTDNGHHGINNGHGGDNLFVDFDLRTSFVHDLTNEWYAHGVVFTRGRAVDLSLDHHRAAPYSTLWTELHAGAGSQIFRSGGRADRGPHTAAYDTLWNIHADVQMGFPAPDYGPRMNYVGFQTTDDPPGSAVEWHVEAIAPDELEPPNLWEAMRARRFGPPPDPDAGPSEDGGARDTGTEPADSSVARDSDVPADGDVRDAGDVEPPSEGCGCHAAPRGRAPLLWLALLVAVLARARPRRE